MTAPLSRSEIKALSERGPGGVRVLGDAMQALGWSAGLQELARGHGGKPRLWELTIADEPTVLISAVHAGGAERLTSLGYTRQTRYGISWTQDCLSLHDMLRWKERPGDPPLFIADLGIPGDVDELLGLLARDDVLEEVPTDLVPTEAGTQREALPGLLGRALKQLRLDVAGAEAYQGRDVSGLDTAVLRLFHQLLYVRISEDRNQKYSTRRIAELVDSASPNPGLAKLLRDYRASANSELFEPAGVAVEELPPESLREVLRQTVEPWARLQLDFSVARADLAGRLYESYLASLPAPDRGDRKKRLFAVAQSVDEREKRASFYTPPALAHLLTRRALNAWIRGRRQPKPSQIRIADAACGSGAFLIASYQWLRDYFEHKHARALRSAEREEILRECIFGADVDDRALGMAQVQLLEVAEISGKLPNLRNNLLEGDALPAPPGVDAQSGQISWDTIMRERGSFTTVVGNPPFGAQAKLPMRLSIEEISNLATIYPEVQAFGRDYAIFFLALGLRLLSSDGTASFVMPRGLIALGQGAPAREQLAKEGVAWITDARAARVFPGASPTISAVVIDRRAKGKKTRVEGIRDSRADGRAVLDDLGSGKEGIFRTSTSAACLSELAKLGWTPFRIRWKEELSNELQRSLEPLVSSATPDRDVRSGVKAARVGDFVIDPASWTSEAGGFIRLADAQLPERYVPPIVYAADIEPFRQLVASRRVLLPFERDGQTTSDGSVLAEVKRRGGLPTNFQRGHLPTLLGPKVLLRAFAREPAAIADPTGSYVPIMRGVHAIRLGDRPPDELVAVATLLNSAFFQWLLRGLGSPRADETIEVSIADLKELPFPDLEPAEIEKLCACNQAISAALNETSPFERIRGFQERRAELDEFVWSMLDASAHLRTLVESELIRLA